MVSVLLLGATGFLGGTVMTDLEAADYDITALVRPGKEDKLSSRKAKVETVRSTSSPCVRDISYRALY